MNKKYEVIDFHIHESNLIVKLLHQAGAEGQFPLTHNDILDVLHMLSKKLEEAGLSLEDLLHG